MRQTKKQDRTDLIGPDRGWINSQNVLFVVAAGAPPVEVLARGQAVTLGHPTINVAGGLILVTGALVIASRARSDLAENFWMSPTPRRAGRLIDTGVYGHVRHPMYSSAILAILGWTIVWGAISGFVVTLVALVFFTLKSRHEEGLLAQHYPDYDGYRQRVRARFIPRPW